MSQKKPNELDVILTQNDTKTVSVRIDLILGAIYGAMLDALRETSTPHLEEMRDNSQIESIFNVSQFVHGGAIEEQLKNFFQGINSARYCGFKTKKEGEMRELEELAKKLGIRRP